MCSGKRDLVRRGGRLRVRAQIEDRAEDIPYMQPCRACLAQYLDDVCDFEEADGRGELALERHSTSDLDEQISPKKGPAIRTHNSSSINPDHGLFTVVESCAHAATMRTVAVTMAGSLFSASANSSSGVCCAVW